MTTIQVIIWLCIVVMWVCTIYFWRETGAWDWLKGKIRARFKDRP